MKIKLRKEYFTYDETQFIETSTLKASLVKYDTGVCAIKLSNRFGYITVLPFNGQMIWDAEFGGRSLKMQTPYDRPKKMDSFLDTYGCYLMHCGALTMGCPGPDDNHPQHGEMPYASYDKAWITAGRDEKGEYIGVLGNFEYNRAFADNYIAAPETRLYAEDAVIKVNVEVENLSNNPMDFMYLCHINNYPQDGGRIVQALPWTKENMQIRYSLPQTVKADDGFENFLEDIKSDIGVTRRIKKEDVYDPEIVFFLKKPKTDDNGSTHFMFVHPDGSADYTSYMPGQLDHCARWILKTNNMQALGLALPATADAEGYTAEKEKGNIKTIPAKGRFKTTIYTGYLDKDHTKEMEKKIQLINNK